MKHFKLKRLLWRMRYWSRSIHRAGFYANINTFNAPRWCISFRIQYWTIYLNFFGFDMLVTAVEMRMISGGPRWPIYYKGKKV